MQLYENNLEKMTAATQKSFNKFNYPNPSEDILYAQRHFHWINDVIDFTRNEQFDQFALSTLNRSYLIDGEDPQFMWMRVAIAIHQRDEYRIKQTYEAMSLLKCTHATPTLFNAGTSIQQMSSCFLLAMKDDSIDGIFQTLRDCAMISKTAGGIGMHISNVRAKGSKIKGTNGVSNGIIPMLRVFNDTARYVDQGGGKRKGSFAIYIEPWHRDIFEFLDLRKNHGVEELRARDLFLAVWASDKFMKRVAAQEKWSLFCPSDVPDLQELTGEEFERRYEEYENDENIPRETVEALEVWKKMLSSQIETGTPYVMFKDACNSKSNQKNMGTIKSSNLCCEVVQYSDAGHTAVCNLASIALPKFLDTETLIFDFGELMEVTRLLTRNLDNIIDQNYYPVPEAANANLSLRPIGIGVQGLADLFQMLGIPYDSEKALALNTVIFECIYYAALKESCQLAKERGKYPRYDGSPISQGQFQFNMWNTQPTSEICDWTALEAQIQEHGVRNSLLTCIMPTASTAQILGNAESVEPYQSNIFTRRTLSGNHIIVNKHLVERLQKKNQWNDEMRDYIIANRGSIADHPDIDDETKRVFKTIWEIRQKWIVDHALARGPYIDQAQSMSLYFAEVNDNKLSSAIFYAWKNGSKNGIYYCRTLPKTNAVAFTANTECVSCSA